MEGTVPPASFQDDGVGSQPLQVLGCVGDADAQARDFEIAVRLQQPGYPLSEERVDIDYSDTWLANCSAHRKAWHDGTGFGVTGNIR